MTFDNLLFRALYWFGFTPWDGHALSRELIEFVQRNTEPGRALDVGCGTGDPAIFLAKHGWSVTAVDFVPQALKRARAKAEAAGVSIRFLEGDATRLSELDAGTGFQLVLDGGCMHGLAEPDRVAYAAQLAAAIAPGGTLLVFGFAEGKRRGPRGVSQAELQRRFASGWRLERMGISEGTSTEPGDPIYFYEFRRI
jgi:SAM-dependent methyltransferase